MRRFYISYFDRTENEFVDVKEKEIHCHFDFQKRNFIFNETNEAGVNKTIKPSETLEKICYVYAKI